MPEAALPLVNIGVPVYNEGQFLSASLESMLAQDYPHLEIILSDNGSTDGTGEICRRFAQQDSRIKYHRFEQNQGVAENFRYVQSQARGKYFMWASGHDLWSSNLVSECVALLEAHPDAVIAFGASQWIDAAGQPYPKFSGWTDTRGMEVVARFFTVFWGNMHPVLGLMRVDALSRARELQSMAGADLILLLEMVLQGHFVHATAAHWSRREFRSTESHDQRIKRYQSSEFGLTKSFADRFFPLARLPVELIRVVLDAEIPWSRKYFILLILLPSIPVKYFVSRAGASTSAT